MSRKTPRKHKPDARNDCDTPVTSHSGSSDKQGDSVLSPHFSPVSVTSPSPSNQGNKGGQLTGVPRKVKDTCADWHNYILEWESLNATGMQIISEIANEKIKAGSEVVSEDGETMSDLTTVLPPTLEDLCHRLKDVYQSMEKILSRFELITTSLEGVVALDRRRHDDSITGSQVEPLFQTWPTEAFYDTSVALLGMYREELLVKGRIQRQVAHSRDRDALLAYTAMWLHQPYITPNADSLLEGMLIETGLR